MIEIIKSNDMLVFNCVWCDKPIIVFLNERFCKIFRHAIYKNNYEQVNQHMSESECNRLVISDLVYGCCKPFEIIERDSKFYIKKCEYK